MWRLSGTVSLVGVFWWQHRRVHSVELEVVPHGSKMAHGTWLESILTGA